MTLVLTIIVWLQQHIMVPVLLAFLLIVVTAYWPGRAASLQRNALIPFDGDR